MKIKKNDIVKIGLGKDRGKTGKVLEVFPRTGKILVENVNVLKKHLRPKREGEKGSVISIARPFLASRVRILCPSCKQTVRVGYLFQGDTKLRICKKCKSQL